VNLQQLTALVTQIHDQITRHANWGRVCVGKADLSVRFLELDSLISRSAIPTRDDEARLMAHERIRIFHLRINDGIPRHDGRNLHFQLHLSKPSILVFSRPSRR
jgi:hypothetical protein